MALDLESLSLTSVFNSLVNYFQSQDNSSKVQDLSASSEGSFLIRLLSNVVSNLSYKLVAQCRENFLSTASLQSSATGIAVNLGYSVFRGSNMKKRVKLIADSDYTLPKLAKVGDYSSEYGIYTLEEVTLKQGEAVEFEVVIGNVKEETFVTGTSEAKCFSLFTEGISEDYSLYLGSVEVPTTNILKEMASDKYLVRTNPYNSVDIMYLNTKSGAKYTYNNGSEITIRYVELADVPDYELSSDSFDYGDLEDYVEVSKYLPFETVDETKINAPLDHETQNLIRSKADYANRVNQTVPLVKSVNWKALTPTFTQATYIKSDLSLISKEEESNLKETLKEERFFGTPLLDLTHPSREVASLEISVAVTNKYKNIADIDEDIANILENYFSKTLQLSFSIYEIEREIEKLSYIKYARVALKVRDREPGETYQTGYIIEKEGNYYRADKVLGTTGLSIPNWNLPLSIPSEVDTGRDTVDGSIVWRAYKKLPGMHYDYYERENNEKYGVGDFVYDASVPNYMFKCIGIKKKSGTTDPGNMSLKKGDFVLDNGFVWVMKDRSSTYNVWEPSTSYDLGDCVNFSGSPEFSAECISYTGLTDTSDEVIFELPEYTVLSQSQEYFQVEGNRLAFFKANDVIIATDSDGNEKTFTVESVNLTSNKKNTQVLVAQEIPDGISYKSLKVAARGTRDGQISWTLIDNVETLDYAWNEYSVFEFEVRVIS